MQSDLFPDLDKKTYVMGIINLTPDSFSGDGLLNQAEVEAAALEQALRFVREGADVLDLGAESTRPGSRKLDATEELQRLLPVLTLIRKELPDYSISTDIIVGFPGETKEDVLETMDVIRQVEFDHAFTFMYSKRTGTPAASMADQVPKEEMKEHFDELLNVVQEISAKRSKRLEGTIEEVLVEDQNSHDAALMTGKMSNNSIVHFAGDKSLIGCFVKVRLDESKGFYYMGTMF